MNKTIYMTYKKNIPEIVFNRWKENNNEYNIDFSLDNDCIDFLKENFNDYIAELFIKLNYGPNKSDLWRLCKLYVYGGVYADVDLVPYINIDTLDKDVTFYSCLSINKHSIFQAFMIHFKPRSNLILHFLISILHNKPFGGGLPTYDMYNCIHYNLNEIDILPDTKYNIDQIKILINIGSSDQQKKKINLYYFPNDIYYEIKVNKNNYKDTFNFSILNNYLFITRTDQNTGWGHNHYITIFIKSKEVLYFFKENIGENNNWITSFVTYKGNKILDSRDLQYNNNGGW
jgi:hypothetical protein